MATITHLIWLTCHSCRWVILPSWTLRWPTIWACAPTISSTRKGLPRMELTSVHMGKQKQPQSLTNLAITSPIDVNKSLVYFSSSRTSRQRMNEDKDDNPRGEYNTTTAVRPMTWTTPQPDWSHSENHGTTTKHNWQGVGYVWDTIYHIVFHFDSSSILIDFNIVQEFFLVHSSLFF